MNKSQLRFLDLVTLVCIHEYETSEGSPPSERTLLKHEVGKFSGLINDSLEYAGLFKASVSDQIKFGGRLQSYDVFRGIINRLRTNGLITKRKFSATQEGVKLAMLLEAEYASILHYPLIMAWDEDGNFDPENSVFGELNVERTRE